MGIWVRAMNGCLIGRFYPLSDISYGLYMALLLALVFGIAFSVFENYSGPGTERYWPISC